MSATAPLGKQADSARAEQGAAPTVPLGKQADSARAEQGAAPTVPLGKQAVFWIMSAPPGTTRTQAQAAKKFDIAQAVVSLAMKRYVAKDIRPDGRRKPRR